MDRTYVRCSGRLTETPGGAVACSLDLRCAAGQLMRSYYATRDEGLRQQLRDAHADRESPG